MNIKKHFLNLDYYSFYPVVISIGFVLIYNLFHYDPIQGYDGEAHHAYVQNFLNLYIPNKIDQPSSNLTYEYFSPPLPYLFPAFVNEICKQVTDYSLLYCQQVYGFINIFFQSVLFFLTILIYIKTLKILNINIQKNTLLVVLFGILTINYKSIAMIRAETYIFFFCSLLIYYLTQLAYKDFLYSKIDIIKFGIVIGAVALSRQWGFLLFPGLFLLAIFVQKNKKKFVYFLVYSFTIGFFISSWFYFNLFFEYGTFTAFNLQPTKFSLLNQPLGFYFPSYYDFQIMFSKPIRPLLDNKFIPILYSDLWGDYWGYFSFTSRNIEIGRGQAFVGDYLARVNIISLLPSIIFLTSIYKNVSYVMRLKRHAYYYLNTYLLISIFIIFIGYFWFAISYPVDSGDTIKSTYLIHLFHLIALSTFMFLHRIKEKHPTAYGFLYLFVLVAFFHNINAMTSHFPQIELDLFFDS